jgi:hypothetical protein
VDFSTNVYILPCGGDKMPGFLRRAAKMVIEQPVVWNFSGAMITHPGIPI